MKEVKNVILGRAVEHSRNMGMTDWKESTRMIVLKFINIPASCKEIHCNFSCLAALEELKIPDFLTHIEFGRATFSKMLS